MSGVDYAPHRPVRQGRARRAVSRGWERFVVALYRGASALLVRVPLRRSEPVARWLFLAGYVLWPAKRRIIQANAAHVLGLPAGHRDVAGLARAIYATYSRFALELMRLPGLPPDEPRRLMRSEGPDHERFMALWERCQRRGSRHHRRERPHRQHRGLRRRLCPAGHPDLRPGRRFGLPRALRAAQPLARALGRDDHPVAAPARHLPRHARARACWAWSWTGATGPTTSRSGSSAPGRRCRSGRPSWRPGRGAVIVPVVARRDDDGRYRPVMYEPIEVADGSPAELARVTQAIADCARGHGRRGARSSGTRSSRCGRRDAAEAAALEAARWSRGRTRRRRP